MVSCGETILTLLLRYFTRHVIEAAALKTEQCFFLLLSFFLFCKVVLVMVLMIPQEDSK